MLDRIKRLWGSPAPTYRVVRWLFPRLLAVCYLIAFWSWVVQCDGLVGEQGILPAKQLMENVHAYEAREHVSLLKDYPCLFYWHYSDELMHQVCWAGVAISVLVIVGIWQGPLLALLWLGYLSIAGTGGVFMGFQWDALLLEAGLLCLFLAPWRLWAWRIGERRPDAPPGAVFLMHWLLFRLMFLSGYVKIGGGDKPWADLTALTYHFETQPLPNVLSWWAHNLPLSVHKLDCGIMYFIELGLPFVLWLGRGGRLAACVGFSLLMGGVGLTGSYNFFNLLTIFLSLTLLDDGWWPGFVKRWLRRPEVPVQHWNWRHAVSSAAIVVLTLFSLVAADEFLVGRIPGYKLKSAEGMATAYGKYVSPWRSVNAYGLFQSMTTERLELSVEVTEDLLLWRELPFKWKPGDVMQAPRFVAPYQPRLDWQMWFAALHPGFVPQRDMDPRSGLQWFGAFLSALLEQRQPVWDLLGEPPFPIDNIRAIRVVQYRYHFTTPEERKATGGWWKREKVGMFSGEFSRRRSVDR
ncbi:MAG: hypothetical protein JWO08_800 [Verrucomicrobiaceae bacterium]|nr:hypothetical protein [Verrucomicrobiaceae bacterium]